MAESGAQRKANLKWKKENTKTVSVTFFPSDMELYDFLSAQGSKAGYIKELIRKAMSSE